MPPFLTSLAAKLLGIGLACLVAGFFGYRLADTIDQNTIKDMKLADLQGVTDAWKLGWAARDRQADLTRKSNTANEADQARIGGNTQEIVRYVTRYIPHQADAACMLPNGFVRLLDAALTTTPADQLPFSAGEPDDAPSGLALSEATALLAQDLGDYAAVRARLLNARDAWNGQGAAVQPADDKPADRPGWWARNIGGL